MPNYVVRHFRDGDEVEINRLFNQVFGTNRTLEEWQWKFRRNPAGVIHVEVAEEGGRLIGHYASMPAFFTYQGATIPVSIPCDNFVHPDYRGGLRGVQKAMHDYHTVFSDWFPKFGFGCPNPAHYVIGKRILKYKDVGEIPVLYRRLGLRLGLRSKIPGLPNSLATLISDLARLPSRWALSARLRRAGGLRTSVVAGFDERVNALWARVHKSFTIGCVRDLPFLRWRFSRPGYRYRIVTAARGDELAGYVVTSVRDEAGARVGYMVDMLSDSDEASAALIARALLQLHADGADYALCWMLADKPQSAVLHQFGFAPREQAFPAVKVVFQNGDPETISDSVLGRLENWYLTMADSDGF